MSTDVPLDAWNGSRRSTTSTACARRNAMIAARGMRQYTSRRHHDASGELVGVTTLTRLGHRSPEHVDH